MTLTADQRLTGPTAADRAAGLEAAGLRQDGVDEAGRPRYAEAGREVPIAVSDDGRTATIDPADLADLTESDRLCGAPASAMIDALEAGAEADPNHWSTYHDQAGTDCAPAEPSPFAEADRELVAAFAADTTTAPPDLDQMAAAVATLEAGYRTEAQLADGLGIVHDDGPLYDFRRSLGIVLPGEPPADLDRPAPFNGPLLAAALAKIVADPDHWDQTEWRVTDADRVAADHPDADPMSDWQRTVCGTSHCLGGWGISLAAEPSQWLQGFSPQGCFSQFLTAVAADPPEHVGRWGTIHVTPAGDWQAGPEVAGVTPFHRAQRLFGLTQEQAMRLFSGGNSLHELQAMVRVLLDTDGSTHLA